MNSDRMSIGKLFLYSIFVLFLSHCTAIQRNQSLPSRESEGGDSSEVSIANDKQNIEELRKNIPEDVKERNDTLKMILSMMGELKEHPNKIRDKFNHFQRTRRTKFQKEQSKSREQFTKNERKSRDQFMKELKSKRDGARTQNMDREQRNNFYANIEDQRKEFFDEQRNNRKEFESEMQQKSRDFYAELKEQQNEFNEEWRIYNKKWQEWQKDKEKQKREKRQNFNSSGRNPLTPREQEGFQQMQNAEAQRLSTDDN